MPKSKVHIGTTVVLLLGVVALVLGLFVSSQMHQREERLFSAFHGTLLKNPRPVAPFQLTGLDGQPFTNDDLKGQWTMLFFGFTSCGSICPITMAELSQMMHYLEGRKVKTYPRVVLVSLDPENDSLEHLKQYVKKFHPSFEAARGEEDVIQSMTKEMGIAYDKVVNPKLAEDKIEHTGTILLFNQRGELAAFFTTPHPPLAMTQDYCLVAHEPRTS